MKEGDFIRWIQGRYGSGPKVRVGPGDDCAVLDLGLDGGTGGQLLATTDALLEGTHFPAGCDARKVGWKSMAVSLSDIAAMGAAPVAALAAVALPRSASSGLETGLYEGMRAVLDLHHVPLVGGDVTSWDGGLCVTTTLLGAVPDGSPVLRSGASPGDELWVTGALGGSLLGRHLEFPPRLAEGRTLRKDFGVRAMIDLSDGLATDALHLAEASGCGLDVEAALVPVSTAARELSRRTGRPALNHALYDGEDFELLFAIAPADAARLAVDWPLETPVSRIGRCTAGDARLVLPDGSTRPLDAGGYEHAWGEP